IRRASLPKFANRRRARARRLRARIEQLIDQVLLNCERLLADLRNYPLRPATQYSSQAATLTGLTSTSLLELAIGIARGFIASGSSSTRSTCWQTHLSRRRHSPAI